LVGPGGSRGFPFFFFFFFFFFFREVAWGCVRWVGRFGHRQHSKKPRDIRGDKTAVPWVPADGKTTKTHFPPPSISKEKQKPKAPFSPPQTYNQPSSLSFSLPTWTLEWPPPHPNTEHGVKKKPFGLFGSSPWVPPPFSGSDKRFSGPQRGPAPFWAPEMGPPAPLGAPPPPIETIPPQKKSPACPFPLYFFTGPPPPPRPGWLFFFFPPHPTSPPIPLRGSSNGSCQG